jgi:beta-lactamase regulating signal transducer with metallopeptidase domain
MIAGQSNFLLALGWAVLNSLWQMAFLWVIYQVLSGFFRKAKASHKSLLATLMIITGFSWFVYTFFSILDASIPGETFISSGFASAGRNEQLNNWLNTMLPVASLLYLVLLILPVFYFIRNYRYVQAIRQFQLSKMDVEWRIFIKNVSARMGIKKPVHIWLSGIVTSPVTIGYLKPVILLPLAAVNQLSTQQLEAVLLHELAHIRRHDYFINLFIRFIQSILYFNPFVKALVNIVEREREKSCDEIVMQFQYDPYGYASALLMLEKSNHLSKPLAVSASGRKNDLLHRIEWMLGIQKKQTISFNKLAGVFAGLLCFITLNGLLILSKPAHKQDKDSSSLAHLASPLYFFSEGSDNTEIVKQKQQEVQEEMPSTAIVNTIQPGAPENNAIRTHDDARSRHDLSLATHAAFLQKSNLDAASSAYTYVRYIEPIVVHELKNYQEEQVKETMEASKKVLEEKQWKAAENKIADVMTTDEKSELKGQYEKEIDKINWKNLEANLRLAYDKIDWNNVNETLNKALTEIRMDSLQQVYNGAVVQLSDLEKQLSENNLQGIPDTDISLKTVTETKKNIQLVINRLNQLKTRKIVHL